VGYDLYLTRAPEWIESAEFPITQPEWSEFAAQRSDLVSTGTITFANIGEQPVYSWIGPDGTAVSLHWFDGRITVSGVPDETFARAVASVAVGLNARAVGEEDEEYQPLE